MLIAFIATSFLVELTPGPNMAYLALLSAGTGRRAGFAAVAGVALGLLVVGVATALGVGALLASSSLAYEILRWAGIGYMLWLAWEGWSGRVEDSSHDRVGERRVKYFRHGFITNILNPKAVIFYVTILPGFIAEGHDATAQVLMLTIIYVVIATAVHMMIVIMAGSAGEFLGDTRRSRIASRVLSLLLAGVAIWLAFDTGR